MSFQDYFIDIGSLDFDISSRGGIDLKSVGEKLVNIKASHHIVDISINGFSNREDFDFEIEKVKWSDLKKHFVKGVEAQKDPKALTVKRAIRLEAKGTTEYIRKRKIEPLLHKYNKTCPKEFCHLGAHFVVDEVNAPQLVNLWKNFDKQKKTTIANSVIRVLSIRFGKEF